MVKTTVDENLKKKKTLNKNKLKLIRIQSSQGNFVCTQIHIVLLQCNCNYVRNVHKYSKMHYRYIVMQVCTFCSHIDRLLIDYIRQYKLLCTMCTRSYEMWRLKLLLLLLCRQCLCFRNKMNINMAVYCVIMVFILLVWISILFLFGVIYMTN